MDNYITDSKIQTNDSYMCCLHDTPRTFGWCEENCDRYYSCDTLAWAGDELNEDKTDEGTNSSGSFKVTITETLQRIVTVDAGSPDEAEQIIFGNWRAGVYILDAGNFIGVEFETVPVNKDDFNKSDSAENDSRREVR